MFLAGAKVVRKKAMDTDVPDLLGLSFFRFLILTSLGSGSGGMTGSILKVGTNPKVNEKIEVDCIKPFIVSSDMNTPGFVIRFSINPETLSECPNTIN